MSPPETKRTGNRRLSRRRPAKINAQVTCRKGPLGLGPNLALGLLDLSDEGVRLLLKAELPPRTEAEITLLGPGLSRALVSVADVVWCLPTAAGTFVAGLHLRRRLSYADLAHLCRNSECGMRRAE